MPDDPRRFDDLLDDLREHPEWRRNLRDLLAEDVNSEPPPPAPPSRLPRWLPTLGMGVLLGAIVAGVAGFVLANEGDDDPEAAAAAVASPTPSAGASAISNSAPVGAASPAPSASPEASSSPANEATASATATEATPTPTATPTTAPTQPAPTQATAAATAPPAAETVAAATPARTSTPRYVFGGFEGTCAPVLAVLNIQDVSQPISVGGTWARSDGNTVITVTPLLLEPADPGTVYTVRFPTYAPLTPGRYTFTATANGAVVAVESTDISC